MIDILLPIAAIAGPALLMLAVHEIRRANRSLPLFRNTPSPCERDAQDGRGEGGKFDPSHTGSNHTQERSNHG